ncbi:GspH/FimT family protein [Synechococcus sp. CS-1332]|uniref:GspH/FimT family protein n=1 Tax=Synechococcus sp. CS-1332 TaxID=2847972 RepID=UPI00223B491E|nr:GspH/FimT family protein [Synechococcus sp. CS-1332]MCT0207768.1 GspH/FimT family protein [Synechococcus sp. CS-1332]
MATPEPGGFTLPETLLALVLVGLLAQLGLSSASTELAAARLDGASRRVMVGLERGRDAALRLGQPCALALTASGWQEPQGSSLPACEGAGIDLGEGLGGGPEVTVSHNLPQVVRFTSNGLIIDGGTVLLSTEGTDLVRCVVVALPLGVTRLGRQGSGGCLPGPRP